MYPIQRTEEKNGSKRHLLVDGRGVSLSLVVTGAHRHDVSQVAAVLEAIVVKRASPPKRRSKHLCADAGYTGAPALAIITKHGYIPHVKGRGQEAGELKLVRYEKLERSFLALNHLAASIMAFRKIKLKVNIIYG